MVQLSRPSRLPADQRASGRDGPIANRRVIRVEWMAAPKRQGRQLVSPHLVGPLPDNQRAEPLGIALDGTYDCAPLIDFPEMLPACGRRVDGVKRIAARNKPNGALEIRGKLGELGIAPVRNLSCQQIEPAHAKYLPTLSQ